MKLLTFVTKGRALLTADGLRCGNPRPDKDQKHGETPGEGIEQHDDVRPCNKLLAKRNRLGQVCGRFKCERCKQEIEVELAPPKTR